MIGRFKGEEFYEALNSQRVARRLTWKTVAEESGVSASSLTRIAQGGHPGVDGLAALLAWSDLKADDFFERSMIAKIETLTQITVALRADCQLGEAEKGILVCVFCAIYESLRKRDRQ